MEITRGKAINMKCLDCMGGTAQDVSSCPSINCPLWGYRSYNGYDGSGFIENKGKWEPIEDKESYSGIKWIPIDDKAHDFAIKKMQRLIIDGHVHDIESYPKIKNDLLDGEISLDRIREAHKSIDENQF